MVSPKTLELSGANFTTIGERLDDGFGLFVDGGFTYVVLDAKTHVIDVLLRHNETTWTDVMTSQPAIVRASVNGQLFGPDNMYGLAVTGVIPPTVVTGEGSIHQGGRRRPEDAAKGEARYCFGRTKDGKRYMCLLGNPPDNMYEGMGGLGPLLMTNPATGAGLPMGDGNRYATDPSKKSIPASDAEWADCVQRNSNHFRDVDGPKACEFCIVAANHTARLLLLGINTDPSEGRLSALRDKLLDAGFDCAAFTDGSNSSCFAVGDEMLVEPHWIKNNLIEAGFKGVQGSAPISVRVTFRSLDILDAGIVLGDEGRWNLSGSVAGAEFGWWSGAVVVEGETLDLGWSTELELSASSRLVLELDIRNVASGTLTGIEPPEVSSFGENLSAASAPPFGEGEWVVTNTDGFYKLHYTVELL